MSDFDNFDDLDAVRDFRSLSAPFPGAVDAAVRRRIFELAAERGYGAGAADHRPTGIPPGSPAGVQPVGRTGGGTALMELGTGGPVRSRRPHRRMVAVSVGLAVALTAGVVIRKSTVSDRVELRGLSPVGQVADPAALGIEGWRSLVAGRPDTPLAADRFAYRKIERGLPAGAIVDGAPVEIGVVRQVQERWAAATRPGRVVVATDRPSDEGGNDEAGPLPVMTDELEPAGAFDGRSYAELRGLPVDAGALAARLDRPGGPSEGAVDGVVTAVLDSLSETALRPEAGVALVELLRRRGLASIGLVTDRAGRPGSGFTLNEGMWHWLVVVDTTTGRVQGWEVRRSGATVPESYLVVLETDVRAEAGAS